MVKLTIGGNMLNTEFRGKYIQAWALIIGLEYDWNMSCPWTPLCTWNCTPSAKLATLQATKFDVQARQ
jgi:hypothetical protein